ncbi:uncharacterized protein AKAW2_20618A [Aspergillus luchuensis]|uniref:Uncharacterized protein n=2 Tax=Aspergillus kawachii TaxID=1069201 RepID=A0A7R8A770_ASPKA|nr:uncharacterized protein AKAW2_20618A [Aspergillus luchuensis]OJZ92542.1 hypothetical protein ASPFODRAFT_265241 [Aspergillus luchuensis CBS 106.47]BCR95678.1 hypothetical protein AKAW2_20618A [Aspergillus luchuensis]BCS08216.1 hypothetical protein ALUC_20586A [Aspergillus luchuensis]
MTESYDSDGPRTPALKPSTINYLPKVSPPPFDTGDQSPKGGLPKHDAEAQFPSSSRKLPEFQKPDSIEGNSVLIRHLEPNRPDIAWFETENPLHRSTPADDPYPVLPKILFAPDKSSVETKEPVDVVARKALNLISPSEPKEGGPSVGPKDPPTAYKEPRRPSIPVEEPALKEEQQQHTPPNIPHISHLFQDGKLPDPEQRLSKLLIAPSEPTAQLPALHPSATASSVNHNLPSLSTALAGVTDVPPPAGAGRLNGSSFGPLPPVSSSSPPVSRTEPVWEHQRLGQIPPPPPQVPPSPYSHLSPASSKDMSAMSSPASQQAYWRPPIKADITYLTSTYETAPQTAKSPATSYPTPTDQTPASTCDRSYNPPTHSNGAVSTGTYKCRHPGCTAAPFQTQYLLNSHANVHSQDRPHFCPIAGCPRGPGGKGFKRKNEMIRHGLVHNSPGYVCPFCPDQQHKYPRPDNLQRHVRVHHVDKSRDDPALRQVLSQRPEGSTRGRRRRNNVP